MGTLPAVTDSSSLDDGQQVFKLIGESGVSYVIETRTNLLQTRWEAMSTNRAGWPGVLLWTNRPDSTPSRFFRARETDP
jgi:hypothetical protein